MDVWSARMVLRRDTKLIVLSRLFLLNLYAFITEDIKGHCSDKIGYLLLARGGVSISKEI